MHSFIKNSIKWLSDKTEIDQNGNCSEQRFFIRSSNEQQLNHVRGHPFVPVTGARKRRETDWWNVKLKQSDLTINHNLSGCLSSDRKLACRDYQSFFSSQISKASREAAKQNSFDELITNEIPYGKNNIQAGRRNVFFPSLSTQERDVWKLSRQNENFTEFQIIRKVYAERRFDKKHSATWNVLGTH